MKKVFQRLARGEGGFSLVEVMVAMMLLVVAAIPMLGMLVAGAAITLDSKRADDARALAQERVDAVKGMPYAEAVAAYSATTVPNEDLRGGCQVRNGAVFKWSIVAKGVDRGWGEAPSGSPNLLGHRFQVRVQGGELVDKYPTVEVSGQEPPAVTPAQLPTGGTWHEATDHACLEGMDPPPGGFDFKVSAVRMPETSTEVERISEDF